MVQTVHRHTLNVFSDSFHFCVIICVFPFPGSLAEGQPRPAAYGDGSHVEPGQPPHAHTQLHQVRDGLWKLLLRRRELVGNVQVSFWLDILFWGTFALVYERTCQGTRKTARK